MNAMKNQITPALLTGKSSDHLVPLPNPLSDKHCLQAEAVEAFLKLQQAANPQVLICNQPAPFAILSDKN